jgi:tRNA dimethylallyltransferase
VDLYVDAILKGFDEFPEIDASVRTTINTNYEKTGHRIFTKNLEVLDPIIINTIHRKSTNFAKSATHDAFCSSVGSGKPYSSFINQKQNSRTLLLF